MTDQTAPRFLAMNTDAVTLARQLLGQRLVRMIRGRRVAGIIVETEAYLGPADRAAHTFGGRRTVRNRSMYLQGGHAYVYFIYGVHYCLNVVCGQANQGTAVLIRALEPTEGLAFMKRRRPVSTAATRYCAGPGVLAQSLAIDRSLDGSDLRTSPRIFIEQVRLRPLPSRHIESTPRVGLNTRGTWSSADHARWADARLRFFIRDHPSVSRR